MLSLKETMEEYNFTERQVCTILDNYMYNKRLEEYLSDEVDNLTELIQQTDKSIVGYKKKLAKGVEYYDEVQSLVYEIETREAQKEEYILKQSTLVTLLNDFRVHERGVI